MNPQLSVVVPVCGEGPNVLPLANQIFGALGSQPSGLELILVDDGSADDTWQRILEAQRADARVRALRHPRSFGQSAALWSGFLAARGSVIATLDGDLQNDPADLPRMLAELGTCEMVCGFRERRMDNWLRRISTRVARLARQVVLGATFKDTGCALRVFKRAVLSNVPPFNGFHRFLPILVQGAGGVVKEIPVSHRARMAGRSKYGVWNRLGRGIFDLLMVRWYLRRQIKAIKAFEQEPGFKQGKATERTEE